MQFARSGLCQPALELTKRNELLPTPPHEPQLACHMLSEELVADA